MQSSRIHVLLATGPYLLTRSEGEMVTFYRGPTVLITHEVFQSGLPDPQRFRVSDLREVSSHGRKPERMNTRSVGATGAAVAVMSVVWPFVRATPAGFGVLLLLLAVPSLIGAACLHRGQPIWELRAVYRGRPVILYATTDARAFGQIRRALIRALEANQLC